VSARSLSCSVDGLALALREIGRIERRLFMLDWIELPDLRRQTTAELNKGEARNALVRAACFHRLGRLRDRAIEAQQYRASGLALVTAAIALWNTVYLDRAIDALRRGGEMIPDALLAHRAPVGWQHINLTGDYLWDGDIGLAPDGFRPSLDSKKPAAGRCRLSVFPIWSCLPCYPARFMASPRHGGYEIGCDEIGDNPAPIPIRVPPRRRTSEACVSASLSRDTISAEIVAHTGCGRPT